MDTFIYECVQAGVICWAGMGLECNVVHHYVYYSFFLFLLLNGSANGLKPKMHYINEGVIGQCKMHCAKDICDR